MQNLYRRNRRWRSSKVVPKGMQNLHRKVNGEEAQKSWDAELVCFSVGVWICVFGIDIILHHIITSFLIASHHTSYRISDMRIEHGVDLRRMLHKNENVLRHEVSFGKYSFISLVTKEGIYFYEAWILLRSMDLFSLRSMKRREGVFSKKAQKWYVCKVSCIAKK
jgi:hypothetical protein